MFAESLTVRILADSSSLRTELDAAARQLGDFQSRAAGLADSGRLISAAFSGLTSAIVPLQTVGKLLTGIQQQISAISGTPLTINTAPAMAALAQLSAAVSAVAGQMLALSTLSTAPATSSLLGKISPGPIPAATTHSCAAMAAGTGMFALATPRAAPLPIPQLTVPAVAVAVNPGIPTPASLPARPPYESSVPPSATHAPRQPSVSAEPSASTVNHFGGITIQVRETADVNAIVRDLRLQGVHLRNRRG